MVSLIRLIQRREEVLETKSAIFARNRLQILLQILGEYKQIN